MLPIKGANSLQQEKLDAIKELHGLLGFSSTPEQIQEAAQACHLFTLPKKRVLFHQGEVPQNFFRVLKGRVQLYMSSDDGEDKRIVAFIGESGSICHEAAIVGAPYLATAESICETRILAWPRQFVLDQIEQYPYMAVSLLKNLSQQHVSATARMKELMMRSSTARVACYLLEHAPSMQSNSYELTLTASKHSISSFLHMSQESMSRILGDLKKAGIIDVHGRVIQVLDAEKLTQIKLARNNPPDSGNGSMHAHSSVACSSAICCH